MKNIEIAIARILSTGTKIASFDYDGVRRNVLIGASEMAYTGQWGTQVDRAIRVSKTGRKFLIAKVHNEGQESVKAFALDKIQNVSAILA